MRKFIGILVMVALVVTTTMSPIVSHAMPHNEKTADATTEAKGHDCHRAAGKASEKEDTSDKCCDKSMCKCVNGNCHNGLAKIFNNGNDSMLFASRQGRLAFDNEFADSTPLEGLKRPPRT